MVPRVDQKMLSAAPFYSPYCLSLSLISDFSLVSINDSRHFEKSGVQLRFLSSEMLAGLLFLGIRLTVSNFHISGHCSVLSDRLKM